MTEQISLQNRTRVRLDAFLRAELPAVTGAESPGELSNSKIRRLIIAGAVSVNSLVIMRPAFELKPNSTINIAFDREKFFFERQPQDVPFTLTDEAVLFEDDRLIFVNKPPFFPVEQTVAGNRNNLHDEVVRYLWQKNPALRNPPYAGTVHRLDHGTSGVIVFAKSRAVNKDVHAVFELHQLEKHYVALCQKPLRPDFSVGQRFTVEQFLARISAKSQAAKWGEIPERNGGLYSRTDFEITGCCRADGTDCFVLACRLFTGRTHQIRVHLSGRELPVLGDVLYGAKPASRLYLHASALAFSSGGISYEVQCPPPFVSA